MKDLYEILGVQKDATQDEIKKAYRELSKKHHPDVGGETDKFQEINLANEILSDPETRAKYDKGEPVFNTQDPEAFIRNRCLQVFSALADSNFDFAHKHIFKHLTENIRASIAQIPNMKQNAQGAICKWEDIKSRLSGENSELYVNILNDKIKTAQKNIDNIDKEIPILEKIIAFLEKTEYKTDEIQNSFTIQYVMHSSTTSSF